MKYTTVIAVDLGAESTHVEIDIDAPDSYPLPRIGEELVFDSARLIGLELIVTRVRHWFDQDGNIDHSPVLVDVVLTPTVADDVTKAYNDGTLLGILLEFPHVVAARNVG